MIPHVDRRLVLGLAMLATAAAPASAGSIRRNYAFTDLGPIGVGGISNAGDIVALESGWGTFSTGTGVLLLREGTVTRLTPPSNPDAEEQGYRDDYFSPRISPGGVVAYNQTRYDGGWPPHDRATVVAGGEAIDLDPGGTGPGAIGVTSVTGVNDHGEVVGWTSNEEGLVFNVRSSPADGQGGGRQDVDLGPLGPAAINNRGQVAGTVWGYPGDSRAAIAEIRDGAVEQTDLGTLGGRSSYAVAISDAGQVVGSSNVSPAVAEAADVPPDVLLDWLGWGFSPEDLITHAFLYENGEMRDLGTLPGHFTSGAEAINSLGQVVGSSSGDSKVAFLYEDGEMFDLNDVLPADSGWVLEQALGINDLGQIVGIGFYSRPGDPLTEELLAALQAAWEAGEFPSPEDFGFDPGFYEQRSFLLTPAPVPEPTAMAVLALAGIALLARRRLRRLGWAGPDQAGSSSRVGGVESSTTHHHPCLVRRRGLDAPDPATRLHWQAQPPRNQETKRSRPSSKGVLGS